MRSKTFVERLESRTHLSTTPKVVAYYPDYRHSVLVSKFDWSAITHVNYFALNVNGSGQLAATSSSGHSFAQMDGVVSTAHSKGVPVNIVIAPGSDFVTFMASEPATTNFINNIKNFCAAHNFDGIDLDFEPGWGSLTQSQISNYGNLINRLSNEAPELQLSAAVNPLRQPTDTIQSYVVPLSAVNGLDVINVMGYDFQLPDHSSYTQSVNALVAWANYAAGASVPKSRFTLGMPFYARNAGGWGNVITYAQVVDQFNPAPNVDNISGWYFNGKNTIANKTNFVLTNGYGGVMFWEPGQDHFTGNNYDTTSLTPVIKSTVGLTAFTTLTSGNLVATGDANANAFSLAVSGTNLEITLGNTTRTYALSSINSITIDGLDGNDSLTISGAINKPLTFNGGVGDDSLTVNAASSVTLNATHVLDALNVAGTLTMQSGGANTLVAKSLNVTGTIDLNDNDLVLDYTGATQAAAVQTLINTARNGGAWDGIGLTSTAARNANPRNTTLAVLEASEFKNLYTPGTPFGGQTVDDTAVLVKYTYYGDTDFNDLVNFDDYSRVDAGFNSGRTGWLNGDLDGNGTVNFDDYSLIDLAFNTQTFPARKIPGRGALRLS